MSKCFDVGLFVLALWSCMATPALAQHLALNLEGQQDELLEIYLPKIAVAADGSYGLTAEALFRTTTGRDVLKVIAQRYSPAGTPVGPTHVFSGESCQVLTDLWLFDYQERPEIAFHPNGTMYVLMQHTGEYQIGTDGVRSAEITIGAIGADGGLIKLSAREGCVQWKLIFVGGGRQDRPRLAMTPAGDLLVTADGFFDGASFRAVAIRVFDSNGNQVIDEAIPHADTRSQQSFHMHPDVAANANLVLSTWHRCPVIDNQGNAVECHVEVQFGTITAQGLQPLGGNQRVNDALGNWHLYPSAAMNGAGQSVIVWLDDRDGPLGEVYAQRFNASGQPVGGNFRVSAGQGELLDGWRPEVALLETGRFMIAWTDSTSAGYRARARTYDAAGNPEGGPFELTPGTISGQPSIAADGNNFAQVHLVAQGGAVTLSSNKSLAITSVDEVPLRDGAFTLSAPYPNPFLSEAFVPYELQAAGHVLVRVFDVLGREVARLVDEARPPGREELHLDGATLAPGLYLIEMILASERRTVSVVRR